jgi:hypothetical protein
MLLNRINFHHFDVISGYVTAGVCGLFQQNNLLSINHTYHAVVGGIASQQFYREYLTSLEREKPLSLKVLS